MSVRPSDARVEALFNNCPLVPDRIKSQEYAATYYWMAMRASCDFHVPGFRERTARDLQAARRNEFVRRVENDPTYANFVKQLGNESPPAFLSEARIAELKAARAKECDGVAETLRNVATAPKPQPRPAPNARYSNPNRTMATVRTALLAGKADDVLRPMTDAARSKFGTRITTMSRADMEALAHTIAPYRFRVWLGKVCSMAEASPNDDTVDLRYAILFENIGGEWHIVDFRGPEFEALLMRR